MIEFLQKHPSIIVGMLVFIAIGAVAYLLILGVRNQRLAEAIYDSDDHPPMDVWHASDQTGCDHCGQRWDRNDLYPPRCTRMRRGDANPIPQPRGTR